MKEQNKKSGMVAVITILFSLEFSTNETKLWTKMLIKNCRQWLVNYGSIFQFDGKCSFVNWNMKFGKKNYTILSDKRQWWLCWAFVNKQAKVTSLFFEYLLLTFIQKKFGSTLNIVTAIVLSSFDDIRYIPKCKRSVPSVVI